MCEIETPEPIDIKRYWPWCVALGGTLLALLFALLVWSATPSSANPLEERKARILASEIKSEDYELLESYLQGHPPLKINVAIALEDGKITYKEFIDLLAQVEVMDAEAAKTSLRKLLK